MRKIAVYGKGGIGKSTISSNLTAALSERSVRVIQIGCDPKHDSTRLLGSGAENYTVLDYLKTVPRQKMKLEDIVCRGYRGCWCVEAGGPEPGIGCAGRGIISAFELLQDLGMDSLHTDITLYDVLGDVVCGGFAVPLRNDYADTVYIVTSGEFMSIYAANNILRGTANYNPDRIGGLIFNSRGEEEELERVERFSKAVGIPIIAKLNRSKEFLDAERLGKTITEAFPDSEIAKTFRKLADTVIEGKRYIAKFLTESDLEKIVLDKTTSKKIKQALEFNKDEKLITKQPYFSRNVERNEALHGCAFSGACTVSASITGLTTLLHSPRSCAQFSFQIAANSTRRSFTNHEPPLKSYANPDIHCTDMNDGTMIFGGTNDLENKLQGLISLGKNDIAIITSCPSGIIGDDVDAVVKKIKKDNPGTSIVPIMEDGNIHGDFMQGVIDASIEIIKTLAQKNLKKTKTVNLIGVKTLSTNCKKNLDTATELLSRIGITVNCNCIGDTSLESIKNLTRADLNVLLSPDQFAYMLKSFLTKEYNMDFAECVTRPGYESTCAWLSEVAEHFGLEKEATAVIEDIHREFLSRIETLKPKLEGCPVFLLSLHKDIDWIMEVIKSTGMIIQRALVIDRPDYSNDFRIRNRFPEVEYLSEYNLEDVKKDIVERNPKLLLVPNNIALEKRIEKCYIPLVPDIGPMSGVDFAEQWIRAMTAPVEEGWRKDAVQ